MRYTEFRNIVETASNNPKVSVIRLNVIDALSLVRDIQSIISSVATHEEDFGIIEIYTDGACANNPGRGGWAAITIDNDGIHKIAGGSKDTTNQRMELTAAIKALQELKEPCEVIIYTDSKYLINGITKWIHSWRDRNWHKSDGKPVKNRDLWVALDQLNQFHNICWSWVKAHNGNKYNDLVDVLAKGAIPS